MKKFNFFLTVYSALLLFPFSTSYSQSFTDNFETGNLNKWTSTQGATISNAFKHSGNYSVYLNSPANGTAQLLKSNPITNYVKIDFYFYITTWDDWTGVQAGGNGLTWFTNCWSDQKVYLWNCSHVDSYNTSIYTPLNYWNRVTVEKSSSGNLKVWLNGNVVVSSYSLGTCASQDITLALSSWQTGRTIKGYIDDVTIYYEPTEVENIGSEVPKEFSLAQNYPNPFNPATKIQFALPKSGSTLLKVYDINGKEMETLVNESLSAGTYTTAFNASNYPSGVYFYKLVSNDFIQTRKMIVAK